MSLSLFTFHIHSAELFSIRSALANHLTENGYTGTFIDARPDILGYNSGKRDALTSFPLLPPEPAFGQLTTPLCTIFNVLPPVLRIKPLDHDYPEIYLSPAHPTNELRWNLLRQACESRSTLRFLSPFFWLWLRSHGIEHFSWTTCAFLILFYLRVSSVFSVN